MTLNEELKEVARWLRQMSGHPAWQGNMKDSKMPLYFEESAKVIERAIARDEELCKTD